MRASAHADHLLKLGLWYHLTSTCQAIRKVLYPFFCDTPINSSMIGAKPAFCFARPLASGNICFRTLGRLDNEFERRIGF